MDAGPVFAELENALPSVPRGTGVATLLAEPARTVTPVGPADPARLGYPVTFPFELALRTSSTRSVCEAYGIDEEEWELIRHDPAFLADLERAMKVVAQDGMSFKIKARLQAEELLKTSWRLIHDITTPPAVRSDLLKATMRWAGYDVPPDKQGAIAGGGAFQINIQFNNSR